MKIENIKQLKNLIADLPDDMPTLSCCSSDNYLGANINVHTVYNEEGEDIGLEDYLWLGYYHE